MFMLEGLWHIASKNKLILSHLKYSQSDKFRVNFIEIGRKK